MYCSNCGKEVINGQKFCAECGARIGTVNVSAPAPAPETSVPGVSAPDSAPATDTAGNTVNVDNLLKSIQLKVNPAVVSAALMLICGLLTLTNTIKINAFLTAETVDIFKLISEEHSTILKLIFIAIYAITLFKMIRTGFAAKKDKRHNILPAAASCITLLMFIAVFVISKKEADAWGADIALSASGMAVVIGSIANAVFLLKPFFASRLKLNQTTGVQ